MKPQSSCFIYCAVTSPPQPHPPNLLPVSAAQYITQKMLHVKLYSGWISPAGNSQKWPLTGVGTMYIFSQSHLLYQPRADVMQ